MKKRIIALLLALLMLTSAGCGSAPAAKEPADEEPAPADPTLIETQLPETNEVKADTDEDKRAAYERHVAGYLVKSHLGVSYGALAQMLDNYWRIVEFPTYRQFRICNRHMLEGIAAG